MAIRSFIALSIPQEMANVLGDCAAQMAYQDKSNAVRWVDQSNFHITLAFLGDQSETALEQLAEVLDQQILCAGIDTSVSHLSPFPESRPKLIAAMIKKTMELETLHKQITGAILASAMSVEKRRFTPHITLGRYRHTRNPFAGTIPAQIDASAELTELVVFESILGLNGAEYDPIFRFPLDEFDYSEV